MRARWVVFAALALSAACDRPGLEGTWTGRDAHDSTVVYSFGPQGSGYYAVGLQRESLTYVLRSGYPNLLEVAIGDPGGADVRRGLVEITWDGRMRLELGPPGGPPPAQLSSEALVLSQPATR